MAQGQARDSLTEFEKTCKACKAAQQSFGRTQDEVDHLREELASVSDRAALLKHSEEQRYTAMIKTQRGRELALQTQLNQLTLERRSAAIDLADVDDRLSSEQHRACSLHQKNRALLKQVKRILARLELAADTSTSRISTETSRVTAKTKGVFDERFRSLCRTLLDIGLSAEKVDKAIHAVVSSIFPEKQLVDHVSGRQFSRFNHEGLLHAELQVAVEIAQCQSE